MRRKKPIITFKATYIPTEVKICYVIKKVEYLFIICRNCLRFGHTAKFCKVKDQTLFNNCTENTHSLDKIKDCNKYCVHFNKTCIQKCKFCPIK